MSSSTTKTASVNRFSGGKNLIMNHVPSVKTTDTLAKKKPPPPPKIYIYLGDVITPPPPLQFPIPQVFAHVMRAVVVV